MEPQVNSKEKTQTSIYVLSSVLALCDVLADEQARSRNQIIEMLLIEALRAKGFEIDSTPLEATRSG